MITVFYGIQIRGYILRATYLCGSLWIQSLYSKKNPDIWPFLCIQSSIKKLDTESTLFKALKSMKETVPFYLVPIIDESKCFVWTGSVHIKRGKQLHAGGEILFVYQLLLFIAASFTVSIAFVNLNNLQI